MAGDRADPVIVVRLVQQLVVGPGQVVVDLVDPLLVEQAELVVEVVLEAALVEEEPEVLVDQEGPGDLAALREGHLEVGVLRVGKVQWHSMPLVSTINCL